MPPWAHKAKELVIDKLFLSIYCFLRRSTAVSSDSVGSMIL